MSNSRTSSPLGSKFTVRGQVYVQTGAFFHPMSNNREVRVLELDTTCPDCSEPFQATASMRQIKARQLIRRCPACRKIHIGPVAIVARAPRRAVKKKTPGPKTQTRSRRPSAVREATPPERITLLEIRPVDLQLGESPATALYRSVLGMLDDEPADVAPPSVVDSYRNALEMLD
jgi:hypothetical protein